MVYRIQLCLQQNIAHSGKRTVFCLFDKTLGKTPSKILEVDEQVLVLVFVFKKNGVVN